MSVGAPVIEGVVDLETLELLLCKIERVIRKEFVKDTERLVDPDALTDLFDVTVPFGGLVRDL